MILYKRTNSWTYYLLNPKTRKMILVYGPGDKEYTIFKADKSQMEGLVKITQHRKYRLVRDIFTRKQSA